MNIRPMMLLMLCCPALSSQGSELIYGGLPPGPIRLVEDHRGRVHVAALGREGRVVRFDRKGPVEWFRGPLEAFEIAPQGDIWLVSKGRVLRYDNSNRAAEPVDRTESFRPRSSPRALFASHLGDLWCGDCRSFRRADGMFGIVPLVTGGGNWRVDPRSNDTFGNLWGVAHQPGGKGKKLVVLTRDRPHRWQTFGLPKEIGGQPWLGPLADDVGFVWLASPTSVIRVEPQADPPAHRVVKCPSAKPLSALTKLSNRQVVAGFADGKIRQLTVKAQGPPEWQLVDTIKGGAVRAMWQDRRGRLWIVCGDRLFRHDGLKLPWHQHWEEQPRMPVGNHDHIFARIGNRLYTAGGKTYFGWPASKWVNLDHVWSYSIETGVWRVEPPMLEPGKAYSGIAALDGELWLIGGLFRDGGGTRPTRTVEIYNPRTRRFRRGPPFKHPFGQVVALTVNRRLYAIGGGNGKLSSPEMVSIGPGESKWRPEPSAPGPIVQASGCVLNDKIYIAGGAASQCPGLFVYDPPTRKWKAIQRPDAPPAAPLCAAFDGEVWVLGGRAPGRGLVEARSYSPETGKWRKRPDLPLPISWAAATEVNGRLMVAGGAYQDSHVGNYFNTDRVFFLRKEKE